MEGSEIEIPSYKQLKNIFVEFSVPSSKEMKVWLHRITPEGNSEPIPATLRIKDGSDTAVQLGANTSSVLIPLTSKANRLEIVFP